MLSIEAAIVASMDSGKIIYPEFIEAVYQISGDIAILTPDSITTIPQDCFSSYIKDWLEALIEI
ncbi:MAG: hypothetical protein AB4080_16930 [Trichodesmium sp.]